MIRCRYENFDEPGVREGKSLFSCERCKQTREYFFDEVCEDCFCEIQKKKGSCVCPFETMKQDRSYYCSFCEEFHGPSYSVMCKECANKNQDAYIQRKGKETSFGVVLASIFAGIVIGLFLGWLLLVKLRKKKIKL